MQVAQFAKGVNPTLQVQVPDPKVYPEAHPVHVVGLEHVEQPVTIPEQLEHAAPPPVVKYPVTQAVQTVVLEHVLQFGM